MLLSPSCHDNQIWTYLKEMQMEVAGDINPLFYPSAVLMWNSKTYSQFSSVQGLNLYNEPKLMELVSLSCRVVSVQGPQ